MVRSSLDQEDAFQGRGHCVVFLNKTLCYQSHHAYPYPGVLVYTAEFHAGGTMYIVNTAMD